MSRSRQAISSSLLLVPGRAPVSISACVTQRVRRALRRAFRVAIDTWKPPGGGYDGALTHDVICECAGEVRRSSSQSPKNSLRPETPMGRRAMSASRNRPAVATMWASSVRVTRRYGPASRSRRAAVPGVRASSSVPSGDRRAESECEPGGVAADRRLCTRLSGIRRCHGWRHLRHRRTIASMAGRSPAFTRVRSRRNCVLSF